jgi:predicted RNase H-like HicB family nuclease
MDQSIRKIMFEVYEDTDGGFVAKAQDLGIITEGDDLPDLRRMIEDAIRGYFFDDHNPPDTYDLIFMSDNDEDW